MTGRSGGVPRDEAIIPGAAGDGRTDDTAAFVAAIRAAAGKTFHVPPGTYLVSGIDLNVPLEMELAPGATIRSKPGNNSPCVRIGASDVTIRGAGPMSRIQEVNTELNCIEIAPGLSNVSVRDLWVKGSGKTLDVKRRTSGCCIAAGISAAGSRSTGIVIEGCYFTDGHVSVFLARCDRSSVRNCSLSNSHKAWVGINLWSSDHCAIEGNRLSDGGGSSTAIEVIHAADHPCRFTAIAGNVIDGKWHYEGINLFGAYASVTGNTVDIVGTCCRISQSFDSTATCVHNTVSGNSFRSDTTLEVVHIQDGGSAGNYGAHYNVIADNNLVQAGLGAGIVVNNSCTWNRIGGNIVRFTGLPARTSDGIGVQGEDADNNAVVNNTVMNAGRSGIYINDADECRVQGNRTYNSGNGGVIVTGSDNCIVIDNHSQADRGVPLGIYRCTPLTVSGNTFTENVNPAQINVYTRNFPIALTAARRFAAIKDALPDRPDGTSLGLGDAPGSAIRGTTTNGGRTANASETCVFPFVMPEGYGQGSLAAVRLRARVSTPRHTAQTIDVSVFVRAAAGGLGKDICTTAAQKLTTSDADYDFVIDNNFVDAGTAILIRVTLATDDRSGASDGYPMLSRVTIRLGAQGYVP